MERSVSIMKTSLWQILSIAIGILLVVAGSLPISFPAFLNHFFPNITEPYQVTAGGVFLITGSAISLIDFRSRKLRQNWRFPGFLLLVVFTVVTILPLFINATSTSSNRNGVFNLPAAKIQTDLAELQPRSPILLILTVDNKEYHYDATLIGVFGTGSAAIVAPYKNKDATIVQISLTSGNNATELDFAEQLANAKAISLLPESPSPTPIPTPGIASDRELLSVSL